MSCRERSYCVLINFSLGHPTDPCADPNNDTPKKLGSTSKQIHKNVQILEKLEEKKERYKNGRVIKPGVELLSVAC